MQYCEPVSVKLGYANPIIGYVKIIPIPYTNT